jgi:transcriptional regulator with GAF, ATPase, and Fis domain
MSSAPDRRLARTLVTLADTLVADFDVLDFLALLAERTVELLDIDAAGVILSDQRGGWRPAAGSSERADLVELFAAQTREGPCLDCVATGTPMVVPDLRDETARWPRFAPAAIGAGFRAACAVPMRLREQSIGALTLLNHAPVDIAAESVEIGQALADVATIGILHHRAASREELLAEQLAATLHHRTVIEQAKGVLAQHGNLEMHQAYTELREHAHAQRRRLSDVARDLADGTIDPAYVIDQAHRHPTGNEPQRHA